MTTQHETLQCCFCDATITPNPVTGWDQGHNPECPDYPELGGHDSRCCDICNDQIVYPSRLARLLASKRVSQQTDDVRHAGQE